MTAERRLSVIETSLSPTQLVLRWLDQAHAFGDLESCVRSLLDAEAADLPLDRLCREAKSGVLAGLRGTRRAVAHKAIRRPARAGVRGEHVASRPVPGVLEPPIPTGRDDIGHADAVARVVRLLRQGPVGRDALRLRVADRSLLGLPDRALLGIVAAVEVGRNGTRACQGTGRCPILPPP